jgi:sRNA-binding carbon storage regulator CsrA
LKPEKEETPKITKGNKRKTTYNKGQISHKAANLGIKSEVKNQLDNILVQANNSSKKALKTGGSAVLKSIKSGIEETGENNSAFKAVDDVIKTADTAVAVEKGITATVNSGIYVTKAGVHTVKAIKNAPKNVSVAKKQFKQKIRKVQKLKRMKKATQTKLLKKMQARLSKHLQQQQKALC